MKFSWRRLAVRTLLLTAPGWCSCSAPGQTPSLPSTPVNGKTLPGEACTNPIAALQGPILTERKGPILPAGRTEEGDKSLPINLATALRLAEARPLVIAAAEASLRTAQARYEGTRVLWLPNVYVGASYYRHDGVSESHSGNANFNGLDQFLGGAGVTAMVSSADAIFLPLAQRQVVRARASEVQAARNDALENVAVAYFNVQQARGQLAGSQDAVEKARQLVRTVETLGKGLAAPIEVERARAQLAEAEEAESSARERWRIASADLTRVLRLDPTAVVAPLEPPYLQVTLISTEETPDSLVEIGLLNRPELAARQALIQAALARLREERVRPLLPIVVVGGDASPTAPGGYLMGGVFGSDVSGHGNPWAGRNDVNVQLLWELRNLGFGNRALVRERGAERDQAMIDLYNVQDRVAAEVMQARAAVLSATTRMTRAEEGLKAAQVSFAGNLKGMSETTRFGDLLTLVNRPQEVVAALQQLQRAYDNYFTIVNDYNRAQFRLYRALGYPAGILACDRPTGSLAPVDTTRPPQMDPACATVPGHSPR
jgi:outer membrane protein TolC